MKNKELGDRTVPINSHHYVINSIGEGSSPPVGQIHLNTHTRWDIIESFVLNQAERKGKDFNPYIRDTRISGRQNVNRITRGRVGINNRVVF